MNYFDQNKFDSSFKVYKINNSSKKLKFKLYIYLKKSKYNIKKILNFKFIFK